MTDARHDDPFDPRASLPPAERARLRDMARERVLAVWADLRAYLGLDADDEDAEPDPDVWTADRASRRAAWDAVVVAAGSVDEAIVAIENRKRREFAGWLVETGRIGEGVEWVTAS